MRRKTSRRIRCKLTSMFAAVLLVLARERGQEVNIALLLEHVDAACEPCQSQYCDDEPNLYHSVYGVAVVVVAA